MSSIDAVTSGGQALREGLFGIRAAFCWQDFKPDKLSELFVTSAATRDVEVRRLPDEQTGLAWLAQP